MIARVQRSFNYRISRDSTRSEVGIKRARATPFFLAFTYLKAANNENENACMLELTVTLIGDARNLF